MSQFPECRLYSERAIAILDASVDPRGEMHLYSALAASLFHTKGPVRETHDAWRKALRIAEVVGATEYQLRAVWGLWSYRLNSGEFNVALARAEDFVRLAGREGNRADLAIGDRMMGTVLHYLGDQPKARRLLERMLEGYATPDARSDIIRFQLEPRVATRSVLARTLWLLGFAEQALQTAEQNVQHAVALGHAVTLYNSQLAASQVALLSRGPHCSHGLRGDAPRSFFQTRHGHLDLVGGRIAGSSCGSNRATPLPGRRSFARRSRSWVRRAQFRASQFYSAPMRPG